MSDVHNSRVRSYNMSRIKGKDTKPELIVRNFLHSAGLRYRLHRRDLPGNPDMTLKKYQTVVFIHGCFWHGHAGCRYFSVPKSNTEWWLSKIYSNKKRDESVRLSLVNSGWKVILIWECELRGPRRATTLDWLLDEICSQVNTQE